MILAPIFLGEPRLCTQKMVVRARTWRGLHQPGVGCHPPRCATSSLPGSSHSVLLIVCLGLFGGESITGVATQMPGLAFSVPARLPGVAAFIKTGFAGVYVA